MRNQHSVVERSNVCTESAMFDLSEVDVIL